MGRAVWELAEGDGGVMVFRLPVVDVDVDVESGARAGVMTKEEEEEEDVRYQHDHAHLSRDEDSNECHLGDEFISCLPSFYDCFGEQSDFRGRDRYSGDDSSETFAAESEGESGDEEILTPQSEGTPILDDSFLQELRVFAGVVNSPPSSSSPVNVTPSQSSGVECEYDSDRTDFLETRTTPTTIPSQPVTPSTSGRTQRLPVRRRLNFRPSINQLNPSKPKSKNAFSLENLRSIERVPRHPWTSDERELLCVLYRWYDSVDSTDIPQVFNEINGLNLRHYIISQQFHNHIRLYGVKAYPEFRRVMDTPFNDPERQYEEIRTMIDVAATKLNLDLQRRKIEEKLPSGFAAKATSPNTRKAYKALVRKAKAQALQSHRNVTNLVLKPMLGGISVTVDENLEDYKEMTDLEYDLFRADPTFAEPPTYSIKATTSSPHLAFRVWDVDSWTSFDENQGFVSKEFANKDNRELMRKVIESEGEGFMVYANKHMSKRGGLSAFVSVVTSLVQALVYASRKKNPQIALIDLNHPSLNKPRKKYYAADTIRWLRKNGLKQYRYRGDCEYIIWADLPRAAVLCHFSLASLSQLVNTHQTCADLLQLERFQPGDNTSTITSHIRSENTTMNTGTARAMGLVAKTFGLDTDEVKLIHIAEFVGRLVDGWSVDSDLPGDIHTRSTVASVFAMALRSPKHHLQDVMGAFCDGIEKGFKCVAMYARRSRRKAQRGQIV